MRDWSLEELATSFLESGFWPHEAVLCIVQDIDDEQRFVVVEGNRRIAALQRLQKAFRGEEPAKSWRDLVQGVPEPTSLFTAVPYMRIESRDAVDAFLGFRHVTGIKEWKPPEKARFIARLIDESGYSYQAVMRKIGSKTPVVIRNYIAHCILVQMDEIEDIHVDTVRDRFSVLFLSLRSRHVQKFLGIEEAFTLSPEEVKPPIDRNHISHLKDYTLWLFGDSENEAIVQDSRQVEKFARVLSSDDALDYLRAVPRPNLEKAFVIAGGDQEEIYELISKASYNLQEALSSLHLYKENPRLISIAKRLIANTEQIRKTLEIG